MLRKGRQLPLVSALLLLITLIFAIRSLWYVDTITWHSLADDRAAVTSTTAGVQTRHLGLRLFYEQELLPLRGVRDLTAALEQVPPAGLSVSSIPLDDVPGRLGRLGLGLERRVDDRPESFVNVASVTVPLWLLAAVFAIDPARRLVGCLRRVHWESAKAGVGMKTGIIVGVVCGIVLGVVVTAVLMRRPAGEPTAAAQAATAPADEGPPIHPIVGTWRIKFDPIVATYSFGNDGNFALSFKGIPGPRGVVEHQATGTWQVQGDILEMRNASSTSGYSVVGERESARILRVEQERLVLQNTDRKGKLETLHFQRVRPFQKGRFDNPRLLGEWRAENLTLELHESGEFVWKTRMLQSAGQWSQEGNRLRMVFEIGDGALPNELSFEIMDTRDRNMLLLHPLQPAGMSRITFYRVN